MNISKQLLNFMGGINPAHKKSPLLTINEKKAIFITTFEHLAYFVNVVYCKTSANCWFSFHLYLLLIWMGSIFLWCQILLFLKLF